MIQRWVTIIIALALEWCQIAVVNGAHYTVALGRCQILRYRKCTAALLVSGGDWGIGQSRDNSYEGRGFDRA